MPKRGVNMHENEVTRVFKTVNDSYVEPISFIVPRRSENFQDDIYPPTFGLTPAMTPSEWFAGKEAIPPKISMASLFDGEGLKEISGIEEKPTGSMSAPAPKPAEPAPVATKPAATATPEPVPAPSPVARPAPSMKEQGASMAAMVNKFADDEDVEEHTDEDSSFDEIKKPVEPSARSPVTESAPVRVSTPPSAVQAKEAEPQVKSPAPVSVSALCMVLFGPT